MKQFARVTKLTNICGRADYISNPDKQEKIVAKSADVDYRPYADFERQNQKSDKKNNEGREVIIALPNAWAKLPNDELCRRAEKLAHGAAGKTEDVQWAVHWNENYTNFHMHVIFSERTRTFTGKVWDRDIYHTADGKVARKKADRAKDADGNELPPVHKKGELQTADFTAKDTRYKAKGWSYEMKAELRRVFAGYGVVFEKSGLLNEYHEGKGKEAPAIRAKNEAIRETNRQYETLVQKHPEAARQQTELKKAAVEAVKAGAVATFSIDKGGKVKVHRWSMQALKQTLEKHSQVFLKVREKGLETLNEVRERLNKTKATDTPSKPENRPQSVFSRFREGINTRREEKAAERAAAAAKLEAERAAHQAEQARIAALQKSVLQECKFRYEVALANNTFRGWQTADGQRAFRELQEGRADQYPALVAGDQYTPWRVVVYSKADLEKAAQALDNSASAFDKQAGIGVKRPETMEEYKKELAAEREKHLASLETKLKDIAAEREQGHSHSRSLSR